MHLTLNPGLFALGAIEGVTYGVFAVGLILVYRISRVINFAHGEIGAVGAAVCGVAVVRWNVPFWAAMALALLTSAGVGALSEVVVVRRLQQAPKLMSLVATLGLASFLLAMSSVINGSVSSGISFPQPPGMPQFHIGVLLVTRSYSAMMIFSPLVVLALVLFLRYSRFGLALRASAANPERARLNGVSAARMSTLAWALSGALAAYTVVLILPSQGFATAEVLGPTVLLRALVPAVVARMTSLPLALGAGIVTGVVDQVLVASYPASGVNEVFLLVLIVVALLLQSPRSGRAVDREDWAKLQPWPALPEELKHVWAIRNLGRVVAAAGLLLALLLGWLGSNTLAVTLTVVVAFSLMGLSIGVLTGLGGQISLGQFAVAGVGATASYAVAFHTGNYVLALAAAAAAGAAVSLILGLPALRVRGLLLAVITLAFALAAQRWILAQPWALDAGVDPGRPIIGSWSLALTKSYFLYSLVIFVFGFWLVRNIWTGGIGLKLRAQRDNEDGARAFSISPVIVKQQAFLMSGVLAGLAGSVYGHLLSTLEAGGFDVLTSINVVALTVIGGLGILTGPVLGALYIIALPRLVPLTSLDLAATSLGWLILVVYFPGGIAQLLANPRARLINWLARRSGVAGIDETSDGRSAEPLRIGDGFAITSHDAENGDHARSRGPALEVTGLRKSFGGVTAVNDVSLTVAAGEILGFIGPNGAGKTTLFELIGGFTAADAGSVRLGGDDVSRRSPEQRARRGLIRSFQDPVLFPTLTVQETMCLSLERGEPTSFLRSALGMHGAERRKIAAAREIVGLMGLQRYEHKQIRELSTGTRRIAELGCAVALRPRVLLLDEPSSGIAQRESEALASVLLELRSYLDATFLVIEHDIPLLMGIADRVIAMDAGRVLASGTPQEVRDNREVVASYLGTDEAAIERSGTAQHSRYAAECQAVTKAGHRCRRRPSEGALCTIHARALAGKS